MNANMPDKLHSCWLKLATGRATQFQTRQLALLLLFKYLQDSTIEPQQKANEVYGFFVKYTAILGSEIGQLNTL